MREPAVTLGAAVPRVKPRRRKEVRDPYDGLRPWSAITHGIGAGLAVIGTLLLVGRSLWEGNWFHAVVIYGLSMICLYTASTLYHCINTSVAKRIALRKYDHCSIYLLIAGSYTPICTTVLREDGGIPLLSVIWALAFAGIILTIAKLDIPRWLTSVIYLVMGWLSLAAIVDGVAGAGRRAVHRGRRTVRGEVAGPEQSPLRLPRDLPRVHPPGLPVPFLPHVPGDRPPMSQIKTV